MRSISSVTFCRRLTAGCIRAGILLVTVASPLAAQLTWTRNVDLRNFAGFPPPFTVDFRAVVKSPLNLSSPFLNDTQWLVTASAYFAVDPATGIASEPVQFPVDVLGLPSSLVTLTGTALAVAGARNNLYPFDLYFTQGGNWTRVLDLDVPGSGSLAASRSGALTVLKPSGGYTISPTGQATLAFGNLGPGNGPGQFDGALYHIHAPNDLMYVLDYGNSRVQMLDPANSFAYNGEFAFESGVTTANMQLAIGADGTVYLGDGLGGGSAYTADGNYIGSFSLPTDAYAPVAGSIAPYLSTSLDGDVYVFDETGFHQYENTPTPEPSSLALVATAGILGALLQARRRRRAH